MKEKEIVTFEGNWPDESNWVKDKLASPQNQDEFKMQVLGDWETNSINLERK